MWTVSCIRPNDNGLPGVMDLQRVQEQIEGMALANIAARNRVDYIQSYDFSEFLERYALLGNAGEATAQGVAAFLAQRGLQDFAAVGKHSVWLSFVAWRQMEGLLRAFEIRAREMTKRNKTSATSQLSYEAEPDKTERRNTSGIIPIITKEDNVPGPEIDTENKGSYYGESSDDLLKNAGGAGGTYQGGLHELSYNAGFALPPKPGFLRQSQMSFNPVTAANLPSGASEIWGPDWKQSQSISALPTSPGFTGTKGEKAVGEDGKGKRATTVEEVPTSAARRVWLVIVWTLTWWIPSFLLSYVGRMKRPDIRIAWREKVALCMLIFLVCASIVSTIDYELGIKTKLICMTLLAVPHSRFRSRTLPTIR